MTQQSGGYGSQSKEPTLTEQVAQGATTAASKTTEFASRPSIKPTSG